MNRMMKKGGDQVKWWEVTGDDDEEATSTFIFLWLWLVKAAAATFTFTTFLLALNSILIRCN